MRLLSCILAAAMTAGAAAPAHATNTIDRDELRAKLVQIVKRINAWNPPRGATETVSCSGADGTTVSFATSTTKDRQLSGSVRVRIGGQTTVVPALLVTTYANEDAGIAMKAFRALSSAELFSFKTELVPTVSPQVDEVATYGGTVSVNGGADRKVTCSAFRQGAGVLKAQVPVANNIGNIDVVCSREATPNAPLMNFQIARNQSQRLISDLIETRAANDSEAIPSFLISQYGFNKARLMVDSDDGGPDGNLVLALRGTGVRVPTNQPAADPAIYGIWTGTYQRFDTGRELNEAVTCYAF